MKKKVWIILTSLIVVVVGGTLYVWYVWAPSQMAKEELSQLPTTSPPILFSKEDYKIVEKEDGKYIVVPKVGLTAKVPEGWKVEIKGSDIPEPEYWIRLFSKDYEPSTKTVTLPGKGCRMNISVWTSRESNQKRRKIIQDLKEGKRKSIGEVYLEEGYEYNLRKISGYDAIEQETLKTHKLAEFVQSISVDIPIHEEEIITFYIDFPPHEKERCVLVWKNFLNNVKIEKIE